MDGRIDARAVHFVHSSHTLSPAPTGDLFIVKHSVKHADGTLSPAEFRFRNADGRLLRFEDQDRLLRIVARLWCEVS